MVCRMRTNGSKIAGSAHEDAALELWYDKAVAAGNDVETYRNYEITIIVRKKNRKLRKKERNISGGKITGKFGI